MEIPDEIGVGAPSSPDKMATKEIEPNLHESNSSYKDYMDVDLSEAVIDEAVGQMPETFNVSMTPTRRTVNEERKKNNGNQASSVASKIPGSSIKTHNHSKGMSI